MANKVITVIDTIGKDIAAPFSHLAQAIAALNTALKAEPAVKTAITGLLSEIQNEGNMITAATTSDGLNVPADVAAATGAAALFTYVKSSFIPAIQSAYNAEKAAIQTGQTQTPAPPATVAAPAAAAATA